jgi:V/A-type H+-transporting ATPase subunit K
MKDMIPNKMPKPLIVVLLILLSMEIAAAQETADKDAPWMQYIPIGAGLSVGLAAVGAGYGVGLAASAALGAIAEKPEMLTWGLVFVALAEGIALYGLAVAFILIGKL